MLKAAFYSYKGGSGRSTTSWNTIQRLVELMSPTEKEPFVIVDADVDSAGSTFLFKAKEDYYGKNCMYHHSVQARMLRKDNINYKGAADSVKKEFFNGMKPIGTFFGLPADQDNAVRLIGTNLDREFITNLGANLSTAGGTELENLNYNITKACKLCGAKALFFDTPSGTQFFARWAIRESNVIVCCMRPTLQFRIGTLMQLIDFVKIDIADNVKRKYILTPTAVCIDPGQEFGKSKDGTPVKYPQTAFEDIKNIFSGDNLGAGEEVEKIFKETVVLDMLDSGGNANCVFGISEVKRFKWAEGCLGVIKNKGEELSGDDKIALERYDLLANTIIKYQNI
jgi:hypothetical protein